MRNSASNQIRRIYGNNRYQPKLVTLINTFTVKPENLEALVRNLEEATDRVMKDQKGFISASIHRGIEGNKVANYAQWKSEDDFKAMLQNPEAKEHMQKAAALAEKFEPLLYTVAFTETVQKD